ncbi:MAG: bis(5'-nucleosyl)-tetraphosphatase (symmetrical) YqeK [Oscillospiraceae bacterium]|jgi:predicted HD superfamily hydrolase involved in NAD metabolism|nr:bis(5'-nucleosyl)-tetraphosphatase (symmetrical) YqeK [Oscillospiraceae bacterium]
MERIRTHEQAQALMASLLPPERLRHSVCVADAAEKLARRCGADAEKAWLAGMLHDCMKYAPPELQQKLCARNGTPLSAVDLDSPKVWHAFAAAAYLRLECGVTDAEILNAVRWHTTGRAGMTLLEKVVFVADLISDDRVYPDVAQVRALAAEQLDAAAKYILEYLFAKLEREGKRMEHPASRAWYDELIREAQEGGILHEPTGTAANACEAAG